MNAPNELLAKLLESKIAARLFDVHTSMPGRILSYDHRTQSATVQPLVRRRYKLPTGERVSEQIAPITHVPVSFYGGGDVAFTFPVRSGMTCTLLFFESSTDKWHVNDGEVDPGDDRRFSLNDAVALLGLRSLRSPIVPAPALDAVVLKVPDTDQIRLGSNEAQERAVLGDTFRAQLDALLAALNTFAGSVGPGAPASALAAAVTAFQAAWGTMLSDKVRLE